MAPKETARSRMLKLHGEGLDEAAARETMKREGYSKSLLGVARGIEKFADARAAR